MKIMYLKWIDIDEKAVVCFLILTNRSISGKTNVCLLGSYSFCNQFGFLTRSCSDFWHFVKKWRTFFRISWIWPDAEDLSNSALSVLFFKMASKIASKMTRRFQKFLMSDCEIVKNTMNCDPLYLIIHFTFFNCLLNGLKVQGPH